MYDPDTQRFRDYAEGHANDSPVDLSGREDAPRRPDCGSANLDGDENCLDPDCIVERADNECPESKIDDPEEIVGVPV